MRTNIALSICFVLSLALIGCDAGPVASDLEADNGAALESYRTAAKTQVDRVDVQAFLPAGGIAGVDDEGNLVPCSNDDPCPLEPGTMYPPTKGGKAKLLRGADYVQVNIHTTGLPPGAYTTWWAIINETDECVPSADPDFPDIVGYCGFDELFDIGGPSMSSVFWSTGRIVQSNGVGNFQDRTDMGEASGESGTQHLWGPGLTNPKGAMVISIIKYHGAPSDDPDVLYDQTHTLLGSCDQGVNGFFDGQVIQCFDPQWAIFAP